MNPDMNKTNDWIKLGESAENSWHEAWGQRRCSIGPCSCLLLAGPPSKPAWGFAARRALDTLGGQKRG